MATMRAVRMHEYGGPEVILWEEVPRPEPAADEVLIHVQAAGVNPVDWKIREGFVKEWFGHQLPLTLRRDLAGVVESTGNKVLAFNPGVVLKHQQVGILQPLNLGTPERVLILILSWYPGVKFRWPAAQHKILIFLSSLY